MGRKATSQILIALALTGGSLSAARVATASNWVPSLTSGGPGEAQAEAQPPAPVGVSATCPGGKTIHVTWNAVTHADRYSIFRSTNGGAYSLTASAITGTSWASGTLSNGTYTYEVSASIGTNWVSPRSGATAPLTITGNNCA
jgi:hypothetical protein